MVSSLVELLYLPATTFGTTQLQVLFKTLLSAIVQLVVPPGLCKDPLPFFTE
jgi:hypothetical protein